MTVLILVIALWCYISVFRAGITGYAGESYFLSNYINSQTLTVHLFTNNLVPNPSNIPSDFTELALSGYSAQTINGGSWTQSHPTGSFYTQATAPNITFTWVGATTIYGYYIVDQSGNLAGAENFGSLVFGSGANSLVLSPLWNAI